MLISFPIMIALYRIIYNIPSYVNSIYSLFQTVAEPISKAANGAEIMEGLIKELNIAVSGFDINNIEKIIDVLNNVMNMMGTEQCIMISHNSELQVDDADIILLKSSENNDYMHGNIIWKY